MDSGGRWWEMSNAASIRCPPGIKKCVSELEILLQKDRALHNCVRLSPWDVDLFFTPKPYVGSVTPFIIHAHVDQLAPLGLPFPMGVAMRRYRPLASDSWGTTTGYSYLICCHAHEAHLPPKPPPFLRGRGGSGVLLLWQPSLKEKFSTKNDFSRYGCYYRSKKVHQRLRYPLFYESNHMTRAFSFW